MAGKFKQAWSSMQAVFSQLLMSNYVRPRMLHSQCVIVLTGELADLHAVPKIAPRKVDAMVIGIARQTVSRVSASKVRIQTTASHIASANTYPAHPKPLQRLTQTV